jgi:hypothetical protein
LLGKNWPFLAGVPLVAAGWAVMWGIRSYWNPLAFAGMWTGAALVMWGLGRTGYPGLKRHLILAGMSVPLWWWFELVNARVHNWRYVYEVDYTPIEFGVLSSIAFATVIPAVVAAYALTRRWLINRDEIDKGEATREPEGVRNGRGRSRSVTWTDQWLYLFFAGLLLQALVFVFPAKLFPFVWVAPFLVVDALLTRAGGPSLIRGMFQGHWRDAIAIGAAGLLCGALWEFWNSWSTPRWEYDVPLLGFWKVFEMPLLGYGGYIPFAWFVLQLVRLLTTYGSLRLGQPAQPL